MVNQEKTSADTAPKHPEVAQRLRCDILRGRFATGRLPGNRVLAESYGVHPITLRKAIRALVDEGLLVARPGRGTFLADPTRRLTGLIEVGVVVHDFFDLSHPYVCKLFRGLSEELCPPRGYMTQLTAIPAAEEWKPTRFARLRQMVDGGFLHALAVNARLSEEEMAALWEMGLPTVVIGRGYRASYPRVVQDNARAAEMVAERLGLWGARRPCFLGTIEMGRGASGEDGHVLDQVLRRLEREGLPVPPERIVLADHDDVDEAFGCREAMRLLHACPDADVLLASGTPLARGALRGLREARWDGVRLLGVTDDDPLEGQTALALPVTEIGRAAGRMLRRQIELHRSRAIETERVTMQWRE